MKKRTQNISLAVIGAFAVMQLFQIEKINPPVLKGYDFLEIENPPEQVATLLRNACYDCHSHESKFPWYTSIQPVGWWIRGHIRGGRQNLNFSEWTDYDADKKAHKLEECAEEVGERHMPMKSYVNMHPEAKLSDADVQVLVDYFNGK